ncbi:MULTISPECIES: DotI/IcmL/TraM family protein [Cysteiniphilum]|uniref:DotI/IcmL/TraM family protein n=1 Tax=Cysteiniphilum TaxID=2056696 RepID=UPI001780470F|nr:MULTISPECIES: DotI/IcmL/TraM family protein [Cysteiniphilum]
MSKLILKRVIEKSQFYQNNFRLLLAVILFLIIANLLLAVGFFYSLSKTNESRYFAVTANGKLVQMHASGKAPINNQTVITWVSEVLPQIYEVDFLNYRRQMTRVSDYFTDYGWRAFSDAFAETLAKIKDKKMVMKAVLQGVPVIVAKGTVDGDPVWEVQVPLLITYSNNKNMESQKYTISIRIKQKASNTVGSLFGIMQLIQAPEG